MDSKPKSPVPSMRAQRHIPRSRDSVGSLPTDLETHQNKAGWEERGRRREKAVWAMETASTSFPPSTYKSPKYGMN